MRKEKADPLSPEKYANLRQPIFRDSANTSLTKVHDIQPQAEVATSHGQELLTRMPNSCCDISWQLTQQFHGYILMIGWIEKDGPQFRASFFQENFLTL